MNVFCVSLYHHSHLALKCSFVIGLQSDRLSGRTVIGFCKPLSKVATQTSCDCIEHNCKCDCVQSSHRLQPLLEWSHVSTELYTSEVGDVWVILSLCNWWKRWGPWFHHRGFSYLGLAGETPQFLTAARSAESGSLQYSFRDKKTGRESVHLLGSEKTQAFTLLPSPSSRSLHPSLFLQLPSVSHSAAAGETSSFVTSDTLQWDV